MNEHQTNQDAPVATNAPQTAEDYYQLLQARRMHTAGHFDRAKRFFIASRESLPCCQAIRNPSRAWANSENTHGRTLKHVRAALAAGLLPGRTA